MEVEVTDVNKQNHETVSCVVDRNVKCIDEPEVCGHVCTCTCSCVNAVVSAELEGLKLERTILESRLLSVTSKSDNESEIKSLRVKLKDLEAVIGHQDELIQVLKEDNSFFKSKLSSIENFMLEVIHNVNQENNANDTSPINMETPSADKTTAHLNSNNKTLTENNDRGSANNVINIPAEITPWVHNWRT
ncbi:Hypothetical predicted protein [Paramuricea clavata]|uniref:Uncharacterized protein n=1 Tax=Paramuricea clavata TaxID=317549 RepID=A0A6S7K0I9_PARCT|nr:Hypothetical predicted protein [Paramuricea clavata]